VEAGLVEFGARVRFPHPLARSAAYRSAQLAERQQLHAALTQATDAGADPDRGPGKGPRPPAADEGRAAELEHAAGCVPGPRRSAAAAAFLERAVFLTADPSRHAETRTPGSTGQPAGRPVRHDPRLLAIAEAGPFDEVVSARVDMVRGQIALASGLGSDAAPLLLKAAKRLEPLHLDLARETYLSAWMAALFAGRLASAGDLLEVCRAVRALPPRADPRTVDLVLDGLALIVTDGPAAAAPALKRAAGPSSTRTSPRRTRCAGAGWPRRRPAFCGTTTHGGRCSSGRSGSPVRRARSTSCR
jgi:hypothetical protein